MTGTAQLKAVDQPAIRFVGMVRSVASWAKVSRELITALHAVGAHVCVDEQPDDRFDPGFPLSVDLDLLIAAGCQAPERPHVAVTFSAPTDYPRLPLGEASIGLLAWEATQWPASWVEAAGRHVSRVAVPASFAQQTLVRSGFPPDRVSVIPHGVDGRLFHAGQRPDPGAGEPLRLLFVGTPARRKGIDILVAAVRTAFVDRTVHLVVKMAPYEDASSRPYLDPTWRAGLAELVAAGHRVDVIEKVVPDDEMPQLYRAADLLCQPFRGECFPLPFLEAMACGTPVLCTAWSGPMDLLNDDVALLARPARAVAAPLMLPDPGSVPETAVMMEPDVAAVAGLLRTADDDRALLAELSRKARVLAARWTWSVAAERLLEQARMTQQKT
jgi:glycosyltransferase involved in cell wall biosynthesis